MLFFHAKPSGIDTAQSTVRQQNFESKYEEEKIYAITDEIERERKIEREGDRERLFEKSNCTMAL